MDGNSIVGGQKLYVAARQRRAESNRFLVAITLLVKVKFLQSDDMLSLCNFLVFRDTYAQTLFLVSLRRALKHKRIVLSMSYKFLKRWLKFSRELVGKE